MCFNASIRPFVACFGKSTSLFARKFSTTSHPRYMDAVDGGEEKSGAIPTPLEFNLDTRNSHV